LVVSDPDHDRYGEHLSAEEVNDLVRPSDKALDLVREWLQLNGMDNLNYSPSKDWIDINIDVESAERLLDTEYYVFEHEDGSQLLRAPKWSLPLHLHEHVDTIQPTTSFFRSERQKFDYVKLPEWNDPDYTPPNSAPIHAVCNESLVTLECFMILYSTENYVVQAPAGKNQIGFNNFLKEVPIRPDTAKFLARYRPEAVGAAEEYKQISIHGGPTQNGSLTKAQWENGISLEADLDVQTIIGMSYPIPVTAYSTGGEPPYKRDNATQTDTNEPYLTWVNYILKQSNIPQVISTSYGDDEQTVPLSYATRVCQQFAQLGARGVSLLFASGDNGVGTNNTCFSNDGKNTPMFLPDFPASCPYVTSVGATHKFYPEVVAYFPPGRLRDGTVYNAYASGGGFSNYFARPKYQENDVVSYITQLKGKYDGLYNKSESHPSVLQNQGTCPILSHVDMRANSIPRRPCLP
jgi:tripeptidyl-peptidase I